MREERASENNEVRAESRVVLAVPAAEVWPRLHDPRSSVVLVDGCVDAWREDESRRGIGEIQVHKIRRHQFRNLVVEFDDGRRAVTRALDVPYEATVETLVTALTSDTTEVIHRFRTLLTPGTSSWRRRRAQRWHDSAAAHVGRELPRLFEDAQVPDGQSGYGVTG